MLNDETHLEGAEVYFVLNRVYNVTQRAVVKELVTKHGYKWIEIPFKASEYRMHQAMDTLGLREVDKRPLNHPEMLHRFERQNANLYLMNNNGARNLALEHGLRQGYSWVLPLDGNCYFDEPSAWDAIRGQLKLAGLRKKTYVAFPLERTSFEVDGNLKRSGIFGEHQLAFSLSARMKFNPLAMYGFRPKVDLLWRLNVPGAWDRWATSVFDHTTPCLTRGISKTKDVEIVEKFTRDSFPTICFGERELAEPNRDEAELTMVSGVSVLRLPDMNKHARGQANLATASEGHVALHARGELRDVAILTRMNLIDNNELEERERARIPHQGAKPLFFNVASMETLRRLFAVGEKNFHTNEIAKLLALADRMIHLPEFSVTDKGLSHVPGVEQRFYQNVRQYDWRACEIPRKAFRADLYDGDSNKIPLETIQDLEWQKNCTIFATWEGHVRPGDQLFSAGSELYDRTRSWAFHSNVTMYSLAYFYTNDPKYAEKGVRLVRKWWLDQVTGMLPSMEYVSFNRDKLSRGVGFIEMKDIAWALDAVELLKQSQVWTDEDSEQLQDWCSSYGNWISTSFIAKTQANETSDQGWYYTLQAAAIRKCAGASDKEVEEFVKGKVKELTRGTFENSGILPVEPNRTRAVHDHYFAMYAVILLWRASENLGWSQTPSVRELESGLHRSVRMALSWDVDQFTNSELSEHSSILCQWLNDVYVTRFKHPGESTMDDLCGGISLPPLVPKDPHSGIVPFSHFMF
jgi:hypothetical protein